MVRIERLQPLRDQVSIYELANFRAVVRVLERERRLTRALGPPMMTISSTRFEAPAPV
jgi:hypothetical protein